MLLNKSRKGSGQVVVPPQRAEGADERPPARVGRFHFPPLRGVAGFRLVAVLPDGRRRVVCVGMSPGQARAHLRANRDAIPDRVSYLAMERWVGERGRGRWEEMA